MTLELNTMHTVLNANEPLARLTLVQLTKDFEQGGVLFVFPEGLLVNFQNLFEEVYQCLELLTRNIGGNSLIMNLLYRVDISEHLVKKALKNSPEYAKTLADLMVRREAQKVIIKAFYGQSKPSDSTENQGKLPLK